MIAHADAPPVARSIFRDGMSRLGSGVNVITSSGPSGCLGFTATAVCSLSDEPPSLLVCMNRSSQQNAPLKENGVFCVNALAPGHRHLSDAFSGMGRIDMAERFKLADWTMAVTGSPVLCDAVVSFDCRIAEVREVNTHSLMIANVVDVRVKEEAGGLVYFARGYHELRPRA